MTSCRDFGAFDPRVQSDFSGTVTSAEVDKTVQKLMATINCFAVIHVVKLHAPLTPVYGVHNATFKQNHKGSLQIFNHKMSKNMFMKWYFSLIMAETSHNVCTSNSVMCNW